MEKINYTYTRERLLPGFDGKFCKTCPCVATDSRGTVLISYQMLLLSGCDVVHDQYMIKSTDGGKTFGEPVLQSKIAPTVQNGIRTVHSAHCLYNKKHKRWYGIGHNTDYETDNSAILVNGVLLAATGTPIFLNVNPDTAEFTDYTEIPFPFDYLTAYSVGQPYEFDNGDILLPFYFTTKEAPGKPQVVTVRYAFEENGLRIVKPGTPIEGPQYKRGLCEPSLSFLKGRFYLTIRSNECGLLSVSDDGYNFSEPTPWKWDDGSILENYNTQQHWIINKNGLFLAYTRRGAHNDHVFRHRAPIFMTRFDEERSCLIRNEEIILVPELGARLGNFWAIEADENQSWLITAEWMQPLGCEKYGSDNSLWLAKIFWEEN